MRASTHNGRAGSHGTYDPKHNDREFDTDRAEGVNSDMTPFNVYWNCIDHRLVMHKDLTENDLSFTEAENIFYQSFYGDYLDGQNERHITSRHKERCRTMDQLRKDRRTCPEETIYQIGNKDSHVDPEVLAKVAVDFFNEYQKRYGDHVHIINWSLHLDESTPHIHERHSFFVVNQYGERCPKQEQACKEMGFDLPDPSKKSGRYNNRKMSFDAEVRKLFIETCRRYGVEIDDEPIYGGKAYLEKQDYIVEKLNNNLKEIKEELKDPESLINRISEDAYMKACEVITEKVVEQTRKEDMAMIERYRDQLLSDESLAPRKLREFSAKCLSAVHGKLSRLKDKAIAAVKTALMAPENRERYTKEIAKEVKPSILEFLRREREQEKKRSNKDNGIIKERKASEHER